MPLTLIQTVLGLSFVFIWVFIATMIVRDGQSAVRRDRDEVPRIPRRHGRGRVIDPARAA